MYTLKEIKEENFKAFRALRKIKRFFIDNKNTIIENIGVSFIKRILVVILGLSMYVSGYVCNMEYE